MRLYVPLSRHEINALVELAQSQRRRPQEQAAVLISMALSKAVQKEDRYNLSSAATLSVPNGGEVADEL